MASKDFVVTTTTELDDRIDRAHRRFADLLADVPEHLSVGEWTGEDVIAHLVTVVNRYNVFDPGRLAPDPRGVDDINERELATLRGRSSAGLLGMLADEMRIFGEQWGPDGGIPLDAPLPFHGGATIDVQAGLTNLIGEFLVHGLDVARAADRPWAIDDRDGILLCGFAAQILPSYVRQTNTDALLVRLELDGLAPWVLDVTGPKASARAAVDGDRPDVVLRGAALALPLLFYGRIQPTDLASHGLDVVGGRYPDRLALLPELFEAA